MARSTFDLDMRGLLGAEEQLALLNLPPQLRRRLLNNVPLCAQPEPPTDPQPAEPGRLAVQRNPGSAKGKRWKRAWGKLLEVTRVNADEAELGWRNALTRWVASQQHNGVSERRTAAQMRKWNKVSKGPGRDQAGKALAPSQFQGPSGGQRTAHARPWRGLKSM